MGWLRKKKPKSDVVSDIVSERGAMVLEDLIEFGHGISNPIKFFSADEICKATDNLNEANHITELSDFGYKWYSGKNENHGVILIKKAVHWFNDYQEGQFCRDIAVSSMELYPVEIREQTWKRRMKIAEDSATALAYLHTAFPRPFVYRSLSIGDILLDEDGVAKLNDFSYCVSIPEGETFVKVDETDGETKWFNLKTFLYLKHRK
ncbi:unnamed protein product [Arabidopsis halleri]